MQCASTYPYIPKTYTSEKGCGQWFWKKAAPTEFCRLVLLLVRGPRRQASSSLGSGLHMQHAVPAMRMRVAAAEYVLVDPRLQD